MKLLLLIIFGEKFAKEMGVICGKLRIANSAKALSNVEVNKLFNRFYTVENARNNSTGLGLSIVKLFTERMGCKLDAGYESGKLVIEIDFPEK